MAIQLDIATSQVGVPFAGAYFRIVTASVARTRNVELRHTVTLDVVGYAMQPQDEDVREVDFRRYHANMADVETQGGDTFLAKCYAWVMARPDMTGSVGV